MMNSAIKGFIFDLDGVLADTTEYHFLRWKKIADELGIPFTRQENEALRGIPRRESLMLILHGRKPGVDRSSS
ncbi:MAG: HAD hydrolase-like protein [Anaerolineales bacterium]